MPIAYGAMDVLKWYEDGCKLIDGKYVPQELLARVSEGFEETIQLVLAQKAGSEELDQIKKSLENVQDSIKQSIQRLETRQDHLEHEQVFIKTAVEDHSQRIQSLEEAGATTKSRSAPLFDIPERNPFFTGRNRDLATIMNRLKDAPRCTITISGLGGVGKTSLALEACKILKEDANNAFPGGIYWLTADTNLGDNTLLSSLAALARRLSLSATEKDQLGLGNIVTEHLEQLQDRSLVNIDNLDTERLSDLANKLVNGDWINRSNVSIIITTRLKAETVGDLLTRSRHLETLTLDSFENEEAVEFLERRTGMVLDPQDCLELAIELGGLPLALDQAAAYIKAVKSIKLSTYLDKLRAEKLKILGKRDANRVTDDTERSRLAVQTTWSLNLLAIKDDCPEAEKLAQVLAFLSPRCIPNVILNSGMPELDDTCS